MSTSNVVANPEHIKKFVAELKKHNRDLRNIQISLRAGMASLSTTWKDRQHSKFAEEYVKTLRSLDHMIALSEAHIPVLLKKARVLDEYQKS